MCGFHVIFHFVWSRKLFAAHRTGKHFALRALVIEEGVPLKTVFVLERFLNVLFGALGALVDSFADFCVTK